jgi:hypothetical protein
VAAKQHAVVRYFRLTDKKTYLDTHWTPSEPYLLHPDGPDGKGPLIAELPVTAPASSNSSVKEK